MDQHTLSEKLSTLADSEGYANSLALLEAKAFSSCVPGICLTDGCDYTREVEPDSRSGYCEICDDTTVISAVALMVEGACDD